MLKEQLESELKSYLERLNNLQKDSNIPCNKASLAHYSHSFTAI